MKKSKIFGKGFFDIISVARGDKPCSQRSASLTILLSAGAASAPWQNI
jgi:hypothetical protein